MGHEEGSLLQLRLFVQNDLAVCFRRFLSGHEPAGGHRADEAPEFTQLSL
jgi:hypothetical protein